VDPARAPDGSSAGVRAGSGCEWIERGRKTGITAARNWWH
jgi:hypothetical protein